jgi:hypothetical protein
MLDKITRDTEQYLEKVN